MNKRKTREGTCPESNAKRVKVTHPAISSLPSAILCTAFSFLPLCDILYTVPLVCQDWYQVSRHDALWGQFLQGDEDAAHRNKYIGPKPSALITFRSMPQRRSPRFTSLFHPGENASSYLYCKARSMIAEIYPGLEPIHKFMRLPMLIIIGQEWMTVEEAMNWYISRTENVDYKKRQPTGLEAQQLLLSTFLNKRRMIEGLRKLV